ncbi:MAG: DUF4286 family protein [Saprospiraceae bacterium]
MGQILYNVTVKVTKDISQDWLQWMKEVHIPDVLATGLFLEHKICKILHEEEDGDTYAIQYYCKNMEDFQTYQENHAKALQKDHSDRYQNKYMAFRTLMEVV